MAEDNGRFPRAGFQLNLGDRNQVDVEVDSQKVWMALSRGLEDLSAWMKDVAGFDLRVEVERQLDGLVITVDRGDNQPAWWPIGEGPQLHLRVNRNQRVVTVLASGPASAEEVVVAKAEI